MVQTPDVTRGGWFQELLLLSHTIHEIPMHLSSGVSKVQKKSKRKRSCLLRFRKVHMVVKGLVGLAPGRRETQKSARDGRVLNGGNDTSWWNLEVFAE